MSYFYRFLIVIGLFIFVAFVWTRDFSTDPEEVFPSTRILADDAAQWHEDGITSPTVLYDQEDRIYKMWYVGKQDRTIAIGYATSDTGVQWTEYASNPVMRSGQDWELGGIQDFEVSKVGNTYHAVYTAVAPGETITHIGYASSENGIQWSKSANNPVLKAGGSEWSISGVINPTLVYVGNRFHMWYEGKDSSNVTRFGYATSSNARNWTELSQNPVLENIQDWSDNGIYAPDVLVQNGVFEMWFHGYDGKDAGLGRAYSVDGLQWTIDSSNPIILNKNNYFVDPAVLANNNERIIYAATEGIYGNPVLNVITWPRQE